MYEADAGQLSIGLTGDFALTRRLSVFREPRFLAIRDALRGCDAVFTNLESAVSRYLDRPHAQRSTVGTYVTTEPNLLDDVKWMGINILANGSSHADDYGLDGVVATNKYLDEFGISHAGSGRHLAEARAPAFLDTPRGRIALVAANAQFNPGSRAGEQRHDTAGHPGVNGFRREILYDLDAESFGHLRDIGAKIGVDAGRARSTYQGDPGSDVPRDGEYGFLGHRFLESETPGVRTIGDPTDVLENLRQVRLARAYADKVIVSLHCHEQGGPTLLTATRRSDVTELADFAIDFGRRCLDEGADIFVAHGPQVPLGIEIYNGKPLFHGLGIFVFQLETLRYLPAEPYHRYGLPERSTPADFIQYRYQDDTRGHTADEMLWHQFYAVCHYDEVNDLSAIHCHPIELGYGKPRSQRGRPIQASSESAERTIERLARLSASYGTKMTYRDGIGVIDL